MRLSSARPFGDIDRGEEPQTGLELLAVGVAAPRREAGARRTAHMMQWSRNFAGVPLVTSLDVWRL